MNRISTAMQMGGALANLHAAQRRQMDAAVQVSSETRATDLKGYGREAETLTAIKSAHARAAAFVAAGESVSARFSAQDLALGTAADAASGAKTAIFEAVANGDATGLMNTLQANFQSAVSALNSKHQGRYLFSGASVDTRPVQVDNLAQLAAAPAVADLFENDRRIATARLDESTTLQVGFLADDLGAPLFEAFRRIQQYAAGPGGPLDGKLTEAQTAYLQSELSAFGDAFQTLLNAQAKNGGLQSQAEAATASQQGVAGQMEELHAGKTGVDMAEAVTRLQLAQTAVQASAQVLATLRGSSLLDLLR